MKSVILNSALSQIAANAHLGFWLSVTHFSLAWVSEEERTANPISPNMTELVRQSPVGGVVKGDLIYNIWQTPFPVSQYAGSFSPSENIASKFQYEYDSCAKHNVLKCNTLSNSSTSWDTALADAGFPYNFSFDGYSESDSSKTSNLTLANMPYDLRYSVHSNQIKGVTSFSYLFPIKSYNLIDDANNNGEVIVNYNLELPAMSSAITQESQLENGIGNFKFNRIGLYMTKCTENTPSDNTKPTYTPMANMEPVLFAVIDIGVNSCNANDVRFDIFKTRDDSGFTGWDLDAQLPIKSGLSGSTLVQSLRTFYIDAVRDQATIYYQNQILNQASLSETVMQLQMMLLQLATAFESATGLNPYKVKAVAGYDVDAILEKNTEYTIANSASSRLLLDATAFRGVFDSDIQYVNDSSSLINLPTKGYSNGDVAKVTITNLDGRRFNRGQSKYPWWTGSIIIASYNGQTKTKLYEIDANNILDMSVAKVTAIMSYSSNRGSWILESVSVVDESNVYSI